MTRITANNQKNRVPGCPFFLLHMLPAEPAFAFHCSETQGLWHCTSETLPPAPSSFPFQSQYNTWNLYEKPPLYLASSTTWGYTVGIHCRTWIGGARARRCRESYFLPSSISHSRGWGRKRSFSCVTVYLPINLVMKCSCHRDVEEFHFCFWNPRGLFDTKCNNIMKYCPGIAVSWPGTRRCILRCKEDLWER